MLEEIPFEAQKVAHGLLAQDGLDPGHFLPAFNYPSFPTMPPCCPEGFAVTAAHRARGLYLLPCPFRRIWQGGRQHGRYDLTGNRGDACMGKRAWAFLGT